MTADPARAALDAEVLEWLGEPLWGEDEERFDTLARALFAHQFASCEPYRRFCSARGRTPDDVRDWREIPPLPAGAFKEMELRSFPAGRDAHVFRTSGTSSARRGELHLDTLELYEASLVPSFCRFLLPDLTAQRPEADILVLAPSPAEARDSSLSHMFAVAVREVGSPASRFFVDSGRLETEALLAALEDSDGSRPLLLCGTSFAFVHLLEALEARGAQLALPPTARVMETGGFKGRSRTLPRPELYGLIEARLGVPVERIANQYGMTELASQFYDSVLREPHAPRRKLGPPWTRVRIVAPEDGTDSETGEDAESGAIVIYDLANTGSVLAIQTADAGRRLGDGFEVLGREPGAEERGCALAADALLAGGQG